LVQAVGRFDGRAHESAGEQTSDAGEVTEGSGRWPGCS
jgi:hypothetical protein